MSINRRQFERLEMYEEAVATDESGRTLGLVSRAGGGGMTIALHQNVSQTFVPGSRLRVVVTEASGVHHTIPVEVKYCEGGNLGVEFVSSV